VPPHERPIGLSTCQLALVGRPQALKALGPSALSSLARSWNAVLMNSSNGFKRVVLATDGSEEADAAVDCTIALLRDSHSSAEVRVVHVWNLEVHHPHGHWDIELRSEAEKLVGATVERLKAAGLRADSEILRADSEHVAGAVAIATRDFKADVVVLGSRGLSDWQSMFKHSVSHRVLSAVDCPVLIVRGHTHGPTGGVRRVLLAIAGGNDLGPGVRAAVAAAAAPGSKVMVVHIAQGIFGGPGLAYVESDDEIRMTMTAAIRLLGDAGVASEGTVAHAGPVAKTVAEIAEAWSADMIVIGSSRMGDLGSLLLGSVSHHLLRTTGRPILIAERIGP
jgi:nucleotide-binding universal stress UspA family protein